MTYVDSLEFYSSSIRHIRVGFFLELILLANNPKPLSQPTLYLTLIHSNNMKGFLKGLLTLVGATLAVAQIAPRMVMYYDQ